MQNISATATIRNRGQMTIPEKIRNIVSWLKTSEIVFISLKGDEIVVKPYQPQKKVVNWKNIWEQIYLSRSLKGRRGNLSDFIIRDRENH